MGGIGFGEIILVLVLAVVIWGGDLPKVARKAANYYVRMRNYLLQVRDEVMRQIPDDISSLPPATDIPIYRDEPPGTVPMPTATSPTAAPPPETQLPAVQAPPPPRPSKPSRKRQPKKKGRTRKAKRR